MAEYERIQPGAFDRILTLTERESKHRQDYENRDLDAGIAIESKSLYLGGAIACFFILGGIICAALDQPWAAAAMVAPPTIGIVGLFLSKSRKRSESENGGGEE